MWYVLEDTDQQIVKLWTESRKNSQLCHIMALTENMYAWQETNKGAVITSQGISIT